MPDLKRDYDVLTEMAQLIEATGAFDAVYLSRPVSEVGTGADRAAFASVHPDQWDEDTARSSGEGDGLEWEHNARFYVEIAVREHDPEVRDRKIDQLQSVVQNAIAGRSILGHTISDTTRIRRGQYLRPDASQRVLRLNGEFSYFVEGSAGHGDGD